MPFVSIVFIVVPKWLQVKYHNVSGQSRAKDVQCIHGFPLHQKPDTESGGAGMVTYRMASVPGDGIGPEVIAEGIKVTYVGNMK